mgnify:CR=1 FL=1
MISLRRLYGLPLIALSILFFLYITGFNTNFINPSNIDWILQVEGHTDHIPIYNAKFQSNWDLSSARAISVVQFLIKEGVKPSRLSAAGFGEFQPLDKRRDEISNRRNRRIEIKLTQR